MRLDRRGFLQHLATGSAVLSFGGVVPLPLLVSAERTVAERILVVIELQGGNDGLNTTAHQSVGWNSPLTISKPAGVCIQELRLRIQKADSVVPKATSVVAIKCTRSDTRPRPNSITPRKVASRKNAVNTS